MPKLRRSRILGFEACHMAPNPAPPCLRCFFWVAPRTFHSQKQTRPGGELASHLAIDRASMQLSQTDVQIVAYDTKLRQKGREQGPPRPTRNQAPGQVGRPL